MLKRLLISTILFVLCFQILCIEEDNEDYKQKYEDLKEDMSLVLDNQQYIKDGPEGLTHNNYIIDEKGYFWYIYEAGLGNYQIMRYNGFESELIKTVYDNLFVDEEEKFNSIQKAHKMDNGNMVFLTPQNIILYSNGEFNPYPFFEDEKITEVFGQNDKLVVIGEKGYYVVENETLLNYKTSIDLTGKHSDKKKEKNLGNLFFDVSDNTAVSKFVITRNKDLLIASFNEIDCGNQIYYLSNPRRNFDKMNLLTPTGYDYYLKFINQTSNDSIFVMTDEEYNQLINPMVEPNLYVDSHEKIKLYFKYTNYLYQIDSNTKKSTRLSLIPDIKIVELFNANNEEWVIYYDDFKVYVSTYKSFINNDKQTFYYECTEEELDLGGAFCLYWEGDIHKFVNIGNFKNKKKTKIGDLDKYKFNYIRYLKRNEVNDIAELCEFNPGFKENGLNGIKYSEQTLIFIRELENLDIKELYTYNIETEKAIVKKVRTSYSIKDVRLIAKNNSLLIFSKLAFFMQYDLNWQKESSLEQEGVIISYDDNNIVIANSGKATILSYVDGRFTVRDSLTNVIDLYFDESNAKLYFIEGKINYNQLNSYHIETGLIDSLFSYSNKSKSWNIFAENGSKLLIVHEDSYQFINLNSNPLQISSEYHSSKLFNLINEECSFSKGLFIDISGLNFLEDQLFFFQKQILFNLLDDTYIVEEDWLSAASTDSLTYVMYYDLEDDMYNYRVSEYYDRAIVKRENDFLYQSSQRIETILLETSNNEYFPIINNQFFYFNNNQWNKCNSYKVLDSIHYFLRFLRMWVTMNMSNGKLNKSLYKSTSQLLSMNDKKISIIDYKTDLNFSYQKKHGLPSNIDQIFFMNNDYFVNDWDGGFFKLNKSFLNPNLDISWLEVNGQRKDLSKPLTFTSKENTIAFPVAILNYMYPEDYPLKYKLTGFDQDWKVGTYSGKITYENLNPGKYSFDVQAFPTDFSDMSWPTIEFRILPPWYKSWWAYTAYFLFISLVIYLIFKQRVKQYKKRQEVLENKVNERTHELSERTLELTEEQRKMRESIEYASLIQRSILPQDSELKLLFQDHFVIWKPRDIVGGDFYWLYENQEEEKAYLAVIDCTGHGVPGALLSMTVNSLLNHTIKDRGITSPAQIIAYLHQEICSLMHQKAERSVQDGFEIALVKLDFADNILTYSGAGLNIILQEPNKELFIMKGDRYNVGGQKLYANINFTEESYNYQPKTKLFLYSDGIVDQPRPDSERIKRLGYKGWIDTLDSLQGLTMNEQAEKLNELIVLMLKEHEQRDDITIIGVEI